MIYYDTYASALGILTIASDGSNITGLWMEGQQHFALPKNSVLLQGLAVIERTKQWLDDYFEGKNPSLSHIPLLPAGTAFQQQVWQILSCIPYGQTMTYSQIASALGNKRMSAQAVGNAVGRNPICILIPCHRVVGLHGLSGYAGGIERKQYLLQLEKSS